MLTEAAQFEMADFNDRCRNFGGKSTSHEQWPANILAEEFQPAEDVDVAPDGGEVEAIARANIAVCGITYGGEADNSFGKRCSRTQEPR
jgi:hypothetical protein